MSTTERYEHSGSAGPTTLAADAAAASMTLTLSDATGYPTGAVGKFWVTLARATINEERILCSSRTGNTLTVNQRGADGTVARAHTAGTVAEHTWSQTEADQTNAHSSTGVAVHGLAGSVVGTTDTQTLTNKTLASPTITGLVSTDFTNAQHDHDDAAGGGNIPISAVAALQTALDDAATLDADALTAHEADTSTHGVATVAGVTEAQTFTNKTLTSPTVDDFSNAEHDHSDSAGGGQVALPMITGNGPASAQTVTQAGPGPKAMIDIDLTAGVWMVFAAVDQILGNNNPITVEFKVTKSAGTATRLGPLEATGYLLKMDTANSELGSNFMEVWSVPSSATLDFTIGYSNGGGSTAATSNDADLYAIRIG